MIAVLRTRGYVDFGLEEMWQWLGAGLGLLGLARCRLSSRSSCSTTTPPW